MKMEVGVHEIRSLFTPRLQPPQSHLGYAHLLSIAIELQGLEEGIVCNNLPSLETQRLCSLKLYHITI